MADEANVVDTVQTAPVENTTEVASTPTEQTSEVQTEESSTGTESQADEQSREGWVPKERMDSYRVKAEGLEAQVAELQEQAKLLKELEKNPTLASAFFKNAPGAGTTQNPEVEKAISTLKANGIPTMDDVKQFIKESKYEENLVSKARELSKKYDGSDGKPKFDPAAVGKFMDTKGTLYDDDGFPDMEAAFRMMHEAEFADAKVKEAKKTTFTERGGQSADTAVDAKTQALEEAKTTGKFGDYLSKFISNPYQK